MKDAVLIKSYQNGINLILREDVPFEQITKELSAKLRSSRSFFGNAEVALSYEGRRLEHGQELALVDVVRQSSDLSLICIVGKDEETNRRYIKAIQKVQEKLPAGSEGQFHKGSLKNREVLETESSIVILRRQSGLCRDVRPEYNHPGRPVRGGLCRNRRRKGNLCGSA